jgi:deazaflavin-dependent oxidoreductase (nitroreductase family)
MAISSRLAAQTYCYLATVGRVTGRRHTVEMWFAADPERDRIYMLSGGRDQSDWVRNIRHDARVRVRVGSRTLTGKARWIEDEPDDPLARRLLAAKYQGWTEGKRLSSWARNSLPVAVELEA